MLAYEFSERAARDVETIQDWYRSQSRDAARRFYDEFTLALRVARDRPMSCPVLKGRVRTVRCSSFPYRIYFVASESRIDVLAVYHTARDPNAWDDADRD